MAQDLRRILDGETLMVIVPHEDDEINLAGASIYGAVQAGMRVICVFMTNGDWYYPGQVRMREAVRSLQCLGVPEEQIIFLGYPDGGVQGERNVYLRGREYPVQAGLHRETYGMETHPDFAWTACGQHQPYLWDCLLQDMEAVIEKYRADILMAVDLDWHPDHRLCSLAFETALGRILNRPGNTYCPRVLKGFAYCTAYESADDFSALNLLSTAYCRGDEDMRSALYADNPALEWESRLRLPVPVPCRRPLLRKNPLYRAMCQHVSQRMFGRAGRIVNGDQVFWMRRTDNLAFAGRWSSSSGETEGLHDFLIARPRDMTGKRSDMTGVCWRPGQEKKPWCRCSFAVPQRICRMVLYGNPEESGCILAAEIRFSNGAVYETGPLRRKAEPTRISFPVQNNVEWVEFRVLRTEGTGAGLSEWEIFENPDSGVRMLQILCDGHFAYNWYVDRRRPPVVGVYCYGIEDGLQWYWNGMRCEIEEVQKRCAVLREPAVVRVEWKKHPAVCSEARLFPQSLRVTAVCRERRLQNQITQWLERRLEKPEHHKARKLAQQIQRESLK